MTELDEAAIRADERARIAYHIRAEMVCCDITERMDALAAAEGVWDEVKHTYVMPQSWYDLKRSHHYHPICYFGGWAAHIAEAQPEGEVDEPDVRHV